MSDRYIMASVTPEFYRQAAAHYSKLLQHSPPGGPTTDSVVRWLDHEFRRGLATTTLLTYYRSALWWRTYACGPPPTAMWDLKHVAKVLDGMQCLRPQLSIMDSREELEMTVSQYNTLLADPSLPPWTKAFLVVLWATADRPKDILRARRITAQAHGHFTITYAKTKTNKKQTHAPLVRDVTVGLRERLLLEHHLRTQTLGGTLWPTQDTQVVFRHYRRLFPQLRAYGCRYRGARVLSQTLGTAATQQHFGHRCTETTRRYAAGVLTPADRQTGALLSTH